MKEKIHGPYKSVKEMLDEYKKWEKKHPIQHFFKVNFYYRACRIWSKIKDVPREIKWFWQRGSRGWADCDTWSIDYHLCRIIPPMIRKLKKNDHGYPYDLSSKQWHKILNNIAWTFDIAADIQNHDVIFPSKKKPGPSLREHYKKFKIKTLTKAEYDRYKEGWRLFQEYFFNLWD
jgi:hypothetical protein